MANFQIVFSPIAPLISEQLKAQKVKIKTDVVKSFQKTADAITLLKYYGYISQQASNVARNKLYKRIMKEVSNG